MTYRRNKPILKVGLDVNECFKLQIEIDVDDSHCLDPARLAMEVFIPNITSEVWRQGQTP